VIDWFIRYLIKVFAFAVLAVMILIIAGLVMD